jgi:hypothetical protein
MVRRHQFTIPNYPVLVFEENFLFQGILMYMSGFNNIGVEFDENFKIEQRTRKVLGPGRSVIDFLISSNNCKK